MSSKTRKKRKSKMKTSRKTRPKTRSLQKLNSPESVESTHPPRHHHHHQQLNLFPLHPEEKDDAPKLSYFFNTDDTATLNSFIWSNNNDSNNNISDVVSEDETSFCRSYPLDHNNSDEVTTTTTTSSLLERSALRGNVKRDLSEEKWVCYEEVTSCVPEYWKKPKKEEDCGGGLLLLKLDYEEIMNAWSDKGPFCIGEEGCQIVPDMLDDVLRQDGFLDTGNVPTLQVPDDGSSVMGNRAARVLRYKEKRQNRLFAKRIRYEVRKLNAEKRPRMKGRFVKRSED